MPEITLAAYALYMTVVFGVRSIIHWLRTGSVGFNGFDADFGSLAWCGGVLFVAAFVLAPVSALLDWMQLLDRVELLDGLPFRATGIALYAIGLAVTFTAQIGMGESWRMGVDATERTPLVSTGIFAIVRNPIFTGMSFAWAGLSLMVPNLAGVLALAAMASAIEIQVRVVEEPYLRSSHGSAYADYARRTGRFLPGIGRDAFGACNTNLR